jgi:hypothetical protein
MINNIMEANKKPEKKLNIADILKRIEKLEKKVKQLEEELKYKEPRHLKFGR